AMLIVAGGMVAGERVKIDLFPKMESDWVLVRATLPIGAPMDQNEKVRRILERAAEKEVESLSAGRDVKILKGISTFVLGSHQIIIIASLYGSDERGISTADFVSGWRNRIGELPGIESLIFRDLAGGPGGGEAVDVRFSHDNGAMLEQACQDLAEYLKAYPGVTDIDDGFSGGKPQLNFTMKPEAGYMGISALDLASQVSSTFWGATVLQQQRGRDVIKAIVRHPKSERSSEYDVEEMLVRTPGGGEMPLFKAVDVKRDRSQTTINRTEGQRTVAVTASVDAAVTTSRKI
ncbi:MAG: efflux RND transporter permease subunit, partial [Desulfobacterales bacterium]|nr:efflux RND transporter permease subunit [Desulfobacterales bacterium]